VVGEEFGFQLIIAAPIRSLLQPVFAGYRAHESDRRVGEAVEQCGVADAELAHEFGEYRLVNGTVIDDLTQPVRRHEQRGGEGVRSPLWRRVDRDDVALDDDLAWVSEQVVSDFVRRRPY
jgi:hypothetical protein